MEIIHDPESLRGHYVAEMGIARAAVGMLSVSLCEA